MSVICGRDLLAAEHEVRTRRKVCLVERGPTRATDGTRTGNGAGGTCVNVGCVPKKVMYEVSRQREGMLGTSKESRSEKVGQRKALRRSQDLAE